MTRISIPFAAVTAFTALALACLAGADSPRIPGGVTIRGTGNTIVIERAPAEPRGPQAPAEELTVYGPIAQAVRMKEDGASDEQVLGFLRSHVDELPSILEASDTQRLRAAGLGKAAIQQLTALAGVDIGWSWPGRSAPEPPAILLAPPVEPFGEAFYGSPAFASTGTRFHRRPAFLPHPGGRLAPIPVRPTPRIPSPDWRLREGGVRRFGD